MCMCNAMYNLLKLDCWDWGLSEKIFVDNTLRHCGYENTQLQRNSTQLNVLMFELANG